MQLAGLPVPALIHQDLVRGSWCQEGVERSCIVEGKSLERLRKKSDLTELRPWWRVLSTVILALRACKSVATSFPPKVPQW